MKFSLVNKALASVISTLVVIILSVTIYNYNNTSKNTIDLFHSIQEGALDASYAAVNIALNVEARRHLEELTNVLSFLRHFQGLAFSPTPAQETHLDPQAP